MPKLHRPKHSLARNVFFFVLLLQKSSMVCWLSSQLQGTSNAHHSRPAPMSFSSNKLFFFGHLLHAHGNAFALPPRFCLSSSSQLIMHIPARALDCISARLVQ
ncbi:hypothetical protein M441DRAFT_69280 [Trichoderma asperellum CBS 433.97]|uniref:Secreted protein n=1 Tax=Trichoderma asperellum (strain ATCC 204424 / CBS 433.97 / NBRC 101777) TaxID=1042311 RepID=A0A2T3Z7S9_TRIA4|nr:hypothetical protein M441DRAFT_69280 [Trichoderma asperellum CBS 433.97]PTB40858.1 hypothetical protein M441DRAFT_69280 [Trichoderma asperellum CBS 433.97]